MDVPNELTEQSSRLLEEEEEEEWAAPRPAGSGEYVWHCSIADVPCTQSAEWSMLLSFVTDEERSRILKFRFDDDRKRALVSVLLQKALIRHHLCASTDKGFCIRRTKENKPYMLVKMSETVSSPSGLWNYNLSHHGQFVGIASHSRLLVGADLVDVQTRSPSIHSARAYVEMFERNLDPKEFSFILAQPDEDSVYLAFFIIWSLKESFIKAIGLGLGFELHNICFTVKFEKSASADGNVQCCGSATAVILSVPRCDWSFQFFSLDHRHIMAVALGPISDAIDSYRACAFLEEDAKAPSDGDCTTAAQIPPTPRTVYSLLTANQFEIFRKASCLPSHEVASCPCCTPLSTHAPVLTGRGVFLDSDHLDGLGIDDDILVTGTPVPRTPFSLPRTPAPLHIASNSNNNSSSSSSSSGSFPTTPVPKAPICCKCCAIA